MNKYYKHLSKAMNNWVYFVQAGDIICCYRRSKNMWQRLSFGPIEGNAEFIPIGFRVITQKNIPAFKGDYYE